MNERLTRIEPPKSPRGTEDLFEPQLLKIEAVTGRLFKEARAWGFTRIDLPTFEHDEVFRRTAEFSEDTSYLFSDKSGRPLVLRPDINAPITRAVINNLSSAPSPIKLFFADKVFRYRHVSKREFRMFGLETYGVSSPLADAEVLRVAANVVEDLGFSGYEIEYGNLQIYYKFLQEIVGRIQNPPDSRTLFHKLRSAKDMSLATSILKDSNVTSEDSEKLLTMLFSSGKDDESFSILETLSRGSKAIEEELEKTKRFREALQEFDLNNTRLSLSNLHGNGFYSGFTYRLTPGGSPMPLVDGGRYDTMAESLGGNKTPATGLGLGIERLIYLAEQQNILIGESQSRKGVIISFEQDQLRADLRPILQAARENGFILEEELVKRKPGQMRRYAANKGYQHAISVSEQNVDGRNAYQVKVHSLEKDDEERTFALENKDDLMNLLNILSK
ncbi:MAG: HisS family protein [Candidatus Levybacteria bacterium]|nr:HisS family protein [Candidatus Levybacteria bacterium]